MKKRLLFSCYAVCMLLSLHACTNASWNDPYVGSGMSNAPNTLYAAFVDRPKHLDPARSYTTDEAVFTGQIYEPPLQYHYLKRPYILIPGSAARMPAVSYLDGDGNRLPDDVTAERVAESVYEIHIRPDIRYQPHPAFAIDDQGSPRYQAQSVEALGHINAIPDFAFTGSRLADAADYIYQIKRLAHPRVHSPILGMMSEHIIGLKALAEELQQAAREQGENEWIDLDRFTLSGVERVDAATLRIRIRGKYPQFLYWLAMPFFAPIPREVDRFYSLPGMAEKNLSLDWWPVGTGPYMLVEHNPNLRMVLEKNPNFHGETYPCVGEAHDEEAGFLDDCDKPLPFIERAVFSREKESIPYWNKFLQGYYDASGLSSDSFDQAVRVNVNGEIGLSDEMSQRGIRLLTSVQPLIFYFGFNMLDPQVGPMDERHKKLRQALSIAINVEEFISIFLNGRGVPAMGPLPPGLYGFEEGKAGINPVVYDWDEQIPPFGAPKRKNIDEARRLLEEAGYPGGRDRITGEPLRLYIDTTSDGGFGDKSKLDWITRQMKALDIQLIVRPTDWNRLQEKMRKGSFQIIFVGWHADYPDPENFLFLLHGPESRANKNGENTVNYSNPEFDRLFEQMKSMDNTDERLRIIHKMIEIVREDSPWAFGFSPQSYTLQHRWLYNRKPSDIGNNTLKYQRIDIIERERARQAWNSPIVWPIWVTIALFILTILPAVLTYVKKERQSGLTRNS